MTAPIDTFRGRFLPYCIEPLPDGRYIVLNRNYKPLGESSGWVDYETHPSATTIKGLTTSNLAKIDWRGAPDADGRIYLYNDASNPIRNAANWEAYAARLQALAELELG